MITEHKKHKTIPIINSVRSKPGADIFSPKYFERTAPKIRNSPGIYREKKTIISPKARTVTLKSQKSIFTRNTSPVTSRVSALPILLTCYNIDKSARYNNNFAHGEIADNLFDFVHIKYCFFEFVF